MAFFVETPALPCPAIESPKAASARNIIDRLYDRLEELDRDVEFRRFLLNEPEYTDVISIEGDQLRIRLVPNFCEANLSMLLILRGDLKVPTAKMQNLKDQFEILVDIEALEEALAVKFSPGLPVSY